MVIMTNLLMFVNILLSSGKAVGLALLSTYPYLCHEL